MMKDTSSSPVTEIPSGEFGQPFIYDPEFRGPVKNRSCTDVLCLFIFLGFIAGWIVVSSFAFKHGNPELLIFPTDSEGNICGVGPFEDRPHLFFFNLLKCARPSIFFTGCPTQQVCVKHCPNETFSVHTLQLTESEEEIKKKLICKYNYNVTWPVKDLIKDDCATLYFESEPFRTPRLPGDLSYGIELKDSLVGRCIPRAFALKINDTTILDFANNPLLDENSENVTSMHVDKASKNLARFLNAREVGEKMFKDFKTSWHFILIGLIFCMALSFLWILLMRWVAGIMVWISIVLVILLSAYASYYSFSMYVELKNQPKGPENSFTVNLDSYLALKNTWLVFGIISALILVIFLVVLLFLRKRIRIAVALIREASKAVGCMMSSLFFPLLPYILQLGVFAFWAAVALFLASCGKKSFVIVGAREGGKLENGAKCDPLKFDNSDGPKCQFKSYGGDNSILGAQIYNAFGLFWGLFFVVGLGQVSLAGAFAAYYWAYNKPKDVPTWAVGVGFWRCVRYHLGSVAFGSLIIAIVRMIRVILEYIDQKCKKYDNPVTKWILWCCKCCFWCLEKFVKFINKNAYIMIAVYGKNFCISAKDAFKLLMRNVIRVVVLDKVTDFLLFIGKLVVVGSSAVLSFYFFSGKVKYLDKYTPNLNYNLVPVIFITLGSYIIATGFFNVYGMAVDTLFLCFLEDCERNDGSTERPYYMSKELMKILDKKNKFRDPSE